MRILIAFLLIPALMAGQAVRTWRLSCSRERSSSDADQLAEAQDLYEKALRSSPHDPDLRFELGMVFFRQHQLVASDRELSRQSQHQTG